VPGDSERLDLEFRPQGGSGFRQATLRADYNGGRQLQLTLLGVAQPAPLPEIRAIPRQLSFGVVNVGTTAMLQLTLVQRFVSPL
jgi:hypothetical protein